jgi:hypothetical protein
MAKGHERYAQVQLSCRIQTHGFVLLLLGLCGYHGHLKPKVSIGCRPSTWNKPLQER